MSYRTSPRPTDAARRNARTYLIGLAASLIGTSALLLVAGIWVKDLTGSSGAAAAVGVCIYAPSLLGPLAGALADRIRLRRMLIAVNLASAALVSGLVAVRSREDVWIVYVVMLAYGASLVLVDAAEGALLPVLLPTPILRQVNGKRLALQEGAKVAAPAIGTAIYAALGGGVVAAVDALSFVIAALALLRIKYDDRRPVAARRALRSDLATGIHHLRTVAELRPLAIAVAIAVLASGVATPAQYGFVDAMGRPATFLGVLTALYGAASIAASLASSVLIHHFGEPALAVAGMVAGVFGYLLRLDPTLGPAILSSIAFGFALPWSVVALINLAQRLTPDALQGRVAAAVGFILFAPQPVAQALGAGAIGRVDYRILYLVAAVPTLAAGLMLARRTRPHARCRAT